MSETRRYFSELNNDVGKAWNRFWFTPSDPLSLCVLRILTGLVALYYHAGYTRDLILWFGPNGLLPRDATQRLAGGLHPSHMYLTDAPLILWLAHIIGFVLLLAFTAGLLTRVTSVLSLLLVLSYVHRAPMLIGQFEPVLTMMMFYLCLAPAGAYLSVDALIRSKQRRSEIDAGDEPPCLNSSWATVATRLLQIHLAAFYIVMATNKLMSDTWWDGGAVWWLIAHTESRLIDLTWLYRAPYVTDAWTHAIVLFEFAFAILIWNRWARPLLIAVSVVMWSSLALITGLVSFCAIMLVANVAFVSPAVMCRFGDSLARKRDEQQKDVKEKIVASIRKS